MTKNKFIMLKLKIIVAFFLCIGIELAHSQDLKNIKAGIDKQYMIDCYQWNQVIVDSNVVKQLDNIMQDFKTSRKGNYKKVIIEPSFIKQEENSCNSFERYKNLVTYMVDNYGFNYHDFLFYGIDNPKFYGKATKNDKGAYFLIIRFQ